MKTFIFTLTTLLIGIAAACHTTDASGRKNAGKGSMLSENTVIKKSSLESFTSLDCSLPVTITYTQGEKCAIELEINENMADRIEYEVRNNCLYIRHKKFLENFSFTSGDIRCQITSPQLQEITLRGAVRFSSSTPIEGKNIKLNCQGASKIQIPNILCTTFEADFRGANHGNLTIGKASRTLIENSGAGTLEISAQSQKTSIYNKGAGKINADLTGDEISLENSGAGKFSVAVHCKKLYGKNNGAGKCNISGTADEVDLKNSGVSCFDVSKLNQ